MERNRQGGKAEECQYPRARLPNSAKTRLVWTVGTGKGLLELKPKGSNTTLVRSVCSSDEDKESIMRDGEMGEEELVLITYTELCRSLKGREGRNRTEWRMRGSPIASLN